MNVIHWLRTPIATLLVLCAALLAQLPHAADVFRLIVAGTGWLAVVHGYAYAVALELAVLLFVVQRRNVESYMFAAVSVCVNLSYYALHGVDLFSVAALPAWLVSIALPAAIARYSHLLVDDAELAPVPQHDAKTAPDATQHRNNAESPVAQPAPVLDAKARALQLASEGLTATQIATEVGVNANTVRSWLRRAATVKVVHP